MGQDKIKARMPVMKRLAKISLGLLMCAGVAGAVATPASARVAVGIGISPGYYGAPYSPAYDPYCDPRSPYYDPYSCGDYGYYGPDYYDYGPFIGFGGYYGGYPSSYAYSYNYAPYSSNYNGTFNTYATSGNGN